MAISIQKNKEVILFLKSLLALSGRWKVTTKLKDNHYCVTKTIAVFILHSNVGPHRLLHDGLLSPANRIILQNTDICGNRCADLGFHFCLTLLECPAYHALTRNNSYSLEEAIHVFTVFKHTTPPA